MNPIPRPITQTGPTSRQIGHSLARLIATIRKMPQPEPKRQPRFRNGMEALAEWEADKF